MRRSRSSPGLAVTAQRRGARLVRLDVRGHAGAGKLGEDIVCAGVSALVQSAAYGLRRHCGARAIVRDDPHGDYILELPEPGNPRAQAVLETALSGLRAIARAYPRRLTVRVQRTGGRPAGEEHIRPRKGA